MPMIASIILAAGRGRRFGSAEDDSKLLARIGEEALVRAVARMALTASPRPVIVVTGHAAPLVADALRDLPVVVVHNGDHATGMASSLRVGVAALPASVDGALVLLADMPLVTSTTLDALVAAFSAAPRPPEAIVPRYEGRRGNPILIGRTMFEAISRLDGDVGARGLFAERGRDIVTCDVDDPGVILDVDTPEALRVMRERT